MELPPDLHLPADQAAVLNEILAAPLAWVRLPLLDSAARSLADAGLVAIWALDTGPVVTLTPLAAARFRVVLIETGAAELPRWHDADQPLPRVVQPRDPAPRGSPPGPDLFALTGIDARPALPREVREWCKHRPRAKETQRA